MPQLSHAQLQDWYQRFARELYEKVNIDVTRKEDLGRVKNYFVTAWDDMEPMGPEVESRYAYIALNGMEYENAAPEQSDFESYSKWMMENLKPAVEDAEIQKLYDMSQAGTLMVIGPGTDNQGVQQVYTDADGNIKMSLPIRMYNPENEHLIPEEERAPLPPAISVAEPDPAAFGLTEEPQKPEQPENMNPGFWSRLGYYLWMDTDYAKLVRYQKAMEVYTEQMSNYTDSVKEFAQAQMDRAQYLADLDEFKANPLGLFGALDNGYRGFQISKDMANPNGPVWGTFQVKEVEFLAREHAKLPQGKAFTEIENIQKILQYGKQTERIMDDLVGMAPIPGDVAEWVSKGVFDPKDYKPQKHQLPVDSELPREERVAAAAYWREMGRLVGFAALADPQICGDDFGKVLGDLFTVGRSGSHDDVKYLEPARDLAYEAINACVAGDAGPMGKLLGQCIRKINQEASQLTELDSRQGLATLYLSGRLLGALEKDPRLMEAAGLSPEELTEARANAACYDVLCRGIESRKDILEYSLYRKDLTPQQIKDAGLDMLFASVIAGEAPANDIKKNLLNKDWVEQSKRELEAGSRLNRMETMDRDALGRSVVSRYDAIKNFGATSGKQEEEFEKAHTTYKSHEKTDEIIVGG